MQYSKLVDALRYDGSNMQAILDHFNIEALTVGQGPPVVITQDGVFTLPFGYWLVLEEGKYRVVNPDNFSAFYRVVT